MSKSFSFIIILISIATLISCSKNGGDTYEAKAAIEAYLQPGQKTLVNITREILAGEDTSGDRIINGLSVVIKYNGTSYSLTQNSSGVYENTTMPVVAGGSYELNFNYNNRLITATTVVPGKPTNFICSPTALTVPAFGGGGVIPTIPDPLKAKWDNATGAYHLLLIKSVDSSASQISTFGGGQRPGFANTPDQGNSKEINFNGFEYYGRNALILYSIQPELAALYNAGSSNSQNLSTVPSNVNNGLGIFTAVNIADSVFVTVN